MAHLPRAPHLTLFLHVGSVHNPESEKFQPRGLACLVICSLACGLSHRFSSSFYPPGLIGNLMASDTCLFYPGCQAQHMRSVGTCPSAQTPRDRAMQMLAAAPHAEPQAFPQCPHPGAPQALTDDKSLSGHPAPGLAALWPAGASNFPRVCPSCKCTHLPTCAPRPHIALT